jgi:mRNA interferase RelE/StbE
VAREYKILLEKRVLKQLGKLEDDVKHRILDVLRIFRDEGFSAKLDLKKLRGYKKHYRLRVGKYRVLFELQPGRVIVVYDVLPRKVAY